MLEDLASRGVLFDATDVKQKIVMCFPDEIFLNDPEYEESAAYAIPNGNLAVFKAGFCNRVSTQMHEIGHTLGLQHSGDLIDITNPITREGIFGDRTGVM